MRRFRCRFVVVSTLCVALAGTGQAANKKPLSERINAILTQPDLAHGFWGIEITSLTTGKVIYAKNPENLFTPASNTKLFTTAAALALIGPDYKFRTSVETSGLLDKHGRLSAA